MYIFLDRMAFALSLFVIGGVWAADPMKLDTNYKIGITVIALGMAYVAGNAIYKHNEQSKAPANPVISVHPALLPAYERYKSKLGDCEGAAEEIRQVYHAEHEGATVVWVEPIPTIYLLARDGQLKSLPDPMAPDDSWFSDKKNRERFKTPADKNPPWGSIARGWALRPKDWNWLGWRLWHCRYLGKTYLQRFQRGLVIGVLRRIQGTDTHGILLVLLTEENRWQGAVVEAESGGPTCTPPPQIN